MHTNAIEFRKKACWPKREIYVHRRSLFKEQNFREDLKLFYLSGSYRKRLIERDLFLLKILMKILVKTLGKTHRIRRTVSVSSTNSRTQHSFSFFITVHHSLANWFRKIEQLFPNFGIHRSKEPFPGGEWNYKYPTGQPI